MRKVLLTDLKCFIRENYRNMTDNVIAERFNLSRSYVMKVRQRMGLSKDLILIAEIRSLKPKKPIKHFTRTRQYKLLPAWLQAEYRAWCRANGEKPL